MTANQAGLPRLAELSAVLPAFNEAANIERTVRECVAYLERKGLDYELLVVNDGSADGTDRILTRLAAEIPALRHLAHDRNRGYGAALRTGFAAAAKGFIFYMDSDGQFDVNDLERLLPLVTDTQHIVTGFRIVRCDPMMRRINAWLFGAMVRHLLGVRVRDLNCAFKIIPKAVLDRLSLESNGALINAELYGRAIRHGVGIKEVGVPHYPRTAGAQTGAMLSVVVRALRELLVLRAKILAEASRPAAPRDHAVADNSKNVRSQPS